LVSLLCWIVFNLTVVTPFYAVHKPGSLLFSIFVGLTLAAALWLLQRGSLRDASLLYLCGLWLPATLVIFWNGGIHGVTMVFYVALPISAAWLLGYRAALITAGCCLGSALVMALLEQNGIRLPTYTPGKPFATWTTILAAMIIAAIPVARVLRDLKEALAGSQKDEAALREHKEHLEEVVQQRTAELVKARDRADAANLAKTLFLANMSHELRTPLNAILGFSVLMREDPAISDQHRRDLETVESSGEHLLGLIDDVLDMAKIEAGNISADLTSVDLPALAHNVVSMLRERAEVKNLELLVEVSPAVPRFVRSDAGKLRQVLTNLVGNAIKFTEQGSVVVTLDAKPEENSEKFVLTIDVQDTGIGLGTDDRIRIFDPFVQAAGSRARKGAGLGLSISRHFVTLLGGTIHVKSKLGEGSRFHVELSVERAEAFETPAETEGTKQVAGLEPGQPDYRILVVEDQRENWLLLQRLLEPAGFQIQIAQNGVQALEAFRQWCPHFMDGLEVARRIRQMQGGREVKIVAVTASTFASQREEVLAEGLDDFLRKPYRPGEIFDCMARHLGVRFQYRIAPPAAAETSPTTLRPEQLEALSNELRQGLENAILSLDIQQITMLINQISDRDPASGGALAQLAHGFSYTPILRALESCRGGDGRRKA
jgi:signal transduction histidine kinase/CheY-like chemotaxis protein